MAQGFYFGVMHLWFGLSERDGAILQIVDNC